MWENTLWVSSADNGGPVELSGANNWPLKGGKFSNWEGGIRASAYMSGGFLPLNTRGTASTALIAFWDWCVQAAAMKTFDQPMLPTPCCPLHSRYATFSAFAGQVSFDSRAEAAGLPQPDSFNMWPLLSGENTTNPRTQLLVGSPAGTLGTGGSQQGTVVQGIIVPPYKLLLGPLLNSVWTGPTFPNGTLPDLNITEASP